MVSKDQKVLWAKDLNLKIKKVMDLSTGILTVPAYAVADPGGLGGPPPFIFIPNWRPPLI